MNKVTNKIIIKYKHKYLKKLLDIEKILSKIFPYTNSFKSKNHIFTRYDYVIIKTITFLY